MWLSILSLALSIYFAYVFVTYAEEIQNTPGCNNIAAEKRELIKIYGYVKLVLGGLSALLLLYVLMFGGMTRNVTRKMSRRR